MNSSVFTVASNAITSLWNPLHAAHRKQLLFSCSCSSDRNSTDRLSALKFITCKQLKTKFAYTMNSFPYIHNPSLQRSSMMVMVLLLRVLMWVVVGVGGKIGFVSQWVVDSFCCVTG